MHATDKRTGLYVDLFQQVCDIATVGCADTKRLAYYLTGVGDKETEDIDESYWLI